MADRYIDEDYIKAHLGGGYVDAVAAVTSVSVGIMIEAATAIVQAAMRNSGYSPVETQDPDDVEVIYRVATFGVFRESLASVPEKTIKLPDNWANDRIAQATQGVLDGNIKPAEDPSQAGAVGGAIFTSTTEGETGARPQLATDEELSGY